MRADVLRSAMEAWTRRLALALDVEVALVWPLLGTAVLGAPEVLSIGDGVAVTLRPVDVFGPALRVNAYGVAIAHTHLSTTGPSAADLAVTRRLVAAGVVLGIPVVAHLVVEPSGSHELIGAARAGLSAA